MTIIASAIKFGDLVCFLPQPARHHHILRSVMSNFKGRTDAGYLGEVQGFLNDEGRFMDRRAAYIEAHNCKQLKPRRVGEYDGDELFSEDLW